MKPPCKQCHCHDAREDFAAFATELGLDETALEQAKSAVVYTENRHANVEVARSSINGLGLVCRRPIARGKNVSCAKIGDEWTVAGRFANHARRPNCGVRRMGRALYFTAKRTLRRGEEITVNYRDVKAALENSKRRIKS